MIKTNRFNSSGFGIVGMLAVALVLAALVGAGVYVYKQNENDKNGSKIGTSVFSPSPSGSPSPSPTVDPYEGWKTYVDSENHYSFRYPDGWKITENTNLPGVRLLSPKQEVIVSYGIGQPRSDTTLDLTPLSITALPSSNALSLISGYIKTSAQISPVSQVVDSTLISKYSLTVGKKISFRMFPLLL